MVLDGILGFFPFLLLFPNGFTRVYVCDFRRGLSSECIEWRPADKEKNANNEFFVLSGFPLSRHKHYDPGAILL